MATGIWKPVELEVSIPPHTATQKLAYDNNIYKQYGKIVIVNFDMNIPAGQYRETDYLITGMPTGDPARFMLYDTSAGVWRPFIIDAAGNIHFNTNGVETIPANSWFWGLLIYISD